MRSTFCIVIHQLGMFIERFCNYGIANITLLSQEMVISAPHNGKVSGLQVREGDSVDGTDLVCKIAKA